VRNAFGIDSFVKFLIGRFVGSFLEVDAFNWDED